MTGVRSKQRSLGTVAAAFFSGRFLARRGRALARDGRTARVGFAGANGRTYHAIGRDLVAAGQIAREAVSMQSIAAWLRELASRSDAPIACGEAQGDAGRLVLAAARAGVLVFDADTGTVRGGLSEGFERPEMVVRDADGALHRVGLSADALASGVPLPDGVALPAVVQLVAHGPHGPLPVAERVIGETRGDGPMMVGDSDPVTRLGHLRELRGASPLRDNRLLSREARRHAERVCAERRVAHTLEPGEDPEHRLARRGIRARVVGEVVARASSRGAAMDALVRSPSHHLTLVDRRFTDAGLGTATDGSGHTCLVVLLAAWPRYMGAAALR